MGPSELRKELKRISDLPLDQHRDAMGSLASMTALGCTLQQLAPSDDKYRFNCHAFSLELHDHRLMRVAGNKEAFFGDRIGNGVWLYFVVLAKFFMTDLKQSAVLDDDVVVYLREKAINLDKLRVKHSGRISDGQVISKWGAKGHIWKHDIAHVPSSYEGTDGQLHTMFFRADFNAIRGNFENYIKKHGKIL